TGKNFGMTSQNIRLRNHPRQIQHKHHAHGKPKTTLKHSFNIRKSSHPLIQYFFLRRNNRPTDSILLMKYAGIISPFGMCQRTSNLTPDMAILMKKPPIGVWFIPITEHTEQSLYGYKITALTATPPFY
ncbi:TPA: hypothetical protein ACWOMT_004458, partial [Escherichia coli]